MVDGGRCERFLIRADKLHPSTKLSWEQPALLETLAIGYHTGAHGGPTAGDHILNIGTSPVGLVALDFTQLT